MRYLVAAVPLLLTACSRDPAWFGIWDIVEASRNDVQQTDMGTLEIMREGSKLAVFLRYTWGGQGWQPDPTPTILLGETDVVPQEDLVESYHQKGETYRLWLSPFCEEYQGEPLKVVEYHPGRAVLVGDQNPWPGDPNLSSIELVLER